jgi:hypothetical protein
MPAPARPTSLGTMLEPTPPLAIPVLCLATVSLGVYLFFSAFALEWYPLVVVACVCFVAAGLPALKLVKHR